MSITQKILFHISTPMLGSLVVGGGIAFAVIGALIVRRLVPHHRLKVHHDVADPILGAIAAVYAVLVSFVAISVWQSFDASNANVQKEASYLADVYRDSEGLAPEFHEKIGSLVREYRAAVIDDEWRTMRRGEMSPKVEGLMRNLWTQYTSYEPRTKCEEAFFGESVSKLNLLRELRRQRLMDARTGLPMLLLAVLVIGAMCTISFIFLFGVENVRAQIVMAALLATVISLILFTILALDYPFTGDVSISSDPFQRVLLD